MNWRTALWSSVIDFHDFSSIDRSRVNTSSFARITVVDVLINRVAFLLVQFRRVGPWKFVQHSFDRCKNICTATLLLLPIENQFGPFGSVALYARRTLSPCFSNLYFLGA